MRLLGQKLHNYGTSLGHKLYGGVKSLGHKVYDNRYKLLAGIGATVAAGLIGSNMTNSTGTKIQGSASATDFPKTRLSDTLRAQGKFKKPQTDMFELD